MQELPVIGPKVREIRSERDWTLDKLAAESAVSRSMLSEIERGDANPTFATLWRITSALGIEISDLVDAATADQQDEATIEVTSSSMTPRMSSPDGKVTIRALSPIHTIEALEWYELVFEPGGTLASAAHASSTVEHLTVVAGTVEVASGTAAATVEMGATARYQGDVAHSLRNSDKKLKAKALLVVIGDGRR